MKYDNKQVMPMFCELTPAEHERLSILSEELGEAQRAIGKILRHGYRSRNPVESTPWNNREELERELGDIQFAVRFMAESGDLNTDTIAAFERSKADGINHWLHHNKVDAKRIYDE